MTDQSDKPERQSIPTRTLKAPTAKIIIDSPADAPVTKASVKKLAKLASPAAMRKLAELVHHSNPFVASKCSIQVLDRAFGKVEQNLALKGDVQHSGLTVALTDLASLLYRDGLISKQPDKLSPPDVIEAEFVDATAAAMPAEKDGVE